MCSVLCWFDISLWFCTISYDVVASPHALLGRCRGEDTLADSNLLPGAVAGLAFTSGWLHTSGPSPASDLGVSVKFVS